MVSDEFSEILIKTPIDKLIELIKNEGEVTLEYAATKIGEDLETVEEWASILEEQGIIKIDYKLSKVILKWNAPTKEEFIERKALAEKTRQEVEEKLKNLIKQVEAERSGLQEFLEQLRKFNAEHGEKLELLVSLANEFRSSIQKNEEEVVSLGEKLEQFLSKTESMEDRINLLSNNLKSIKEKFTSFDIEKSSKEFEEKRKSLEETIQRLEKMKEKVEKAKESLLQLSSEFSDLREFAKHVKEIEKKISQFEQKLSNIEEKFEVIKEFKKSANELRQSINKIDLEIDELGEKLKSPSGTLEEIKKTLEELEKKRDSINEQLQLARESAAVVREEIKNLIPSLPTLQEVEALKKELREIRVKIEEWGEASETLERLKDVDRIFDDLVKLSQKIDEEKEDITKTLGEISSMIDEEIQIYNSLQKIKARIFQNTEEYEKELSDLGQEFTKLKEESQHIAVEVENAINKIKTRSPEEVKELINSLEVVIEKGEKLRKIEKEISNLKKQLEVVANNLTLLQKQLTLTRLRTPEEVGREVGLREKEIEEYRKKKEKIMDYLRKLLNEDKEDSKNDKN